MNRMEMMVTAKKTAIGYPWPVSERKDSSSIPDTKPKAVFPKMMLLSKSRCIYINRPRIRPVALWAKSSLAGSLLFFLFDSML
jgi:hypothetical protein